MRLELRQTRGPRAGGGRRWVLEGGRRTLGGGHDCDWQVDDADRTLSDFHCLIESDRNGYVVTDRSAGGTRVGDTVLRQGETARLEHGASIAFGSFAFAVAVFGEAEPELADPDEDLRLSDEALTISAILSDVAPGRRRASGLSGVFGEDEMIPPGGDARRAWEAGGAGVPSSRRVAIGWDGPPAIDAARPLLPSDWNDTAEAGDLSSDLEHRAALTTVMPRLHGRGAGSGSPPTIAGTDADFSGIVAGSGAGEPAAGALLPEVAGEDGGRPIEPETRLGPAFAADAATGVGASLLTASDVDPGGGLGQVAGLRPTEGVTRDDVPFETAPAMSAPRVEALLRDCEDVLGDLAALVGLAPPGPSAAAGGHLSHADRLEELLAKQVALRETVEGWLREIGQRLEPRVIEARVDAASGSFFRPRQNRYWSEYRKQFRRDGRELSVAELLRELTSHAR